MLDDLKANNARWAAARTAADPEFFARLARGQAPPYLWIGCSDSRTPPNEMVGLGPGELFVHRNVANLARPDDPSWRAVLQYAVEVLKVRHVLVAGHTGCGGVAASLRGEAPAAVAAWLRPLRETVAACRTELDACPDEAARLARLTELNVAEQVRNVVGDPVVQGAWARGQALAVHGWVYRLADGLVTDLDLTVDGPPRD